MEFPTPARVISTVAAAHSATEAGTAELPSRPAAGALDMRLIAAARAAARAHAQQDTP